MKQSSSKPSMPLDTVELFLRDLKAELDGDYRPNTLVSWIEYMERFKEHIFPAFEPFGFSFPQAFAVFMMNEKFNALEDLLEEQNSMIMGDEGGDELFNR